MFTWASVTLAALKLLNWIARAVSVMHWKKAGRDEVIAEVNAKTVETINAMEDVPRPSDDDVADSLRKSRF